MYFYAQWLALCCEPDSSTYSKEITEMNTKFFKKQPRPDTPPPLAGPGNVSEYFLESCVCVCDSNRLCNRFFIMQGIPNPPRKTVWRNLLYKGTPVNICADASPYLLGFPFCINRERRLLKMVSLASDLP